MRAGISTACLYPTSTEQALEKLLGQGFDTLELFLNAPSELTADYVKQICSMVKAYQARVVSLHPFTSGMETMLFFSDYPRRLTDGLDYYKRYFAFLGELGGTYLVFHGAHKGMELNTGFYIERYALLHETAKSMGVRVAQENVERCVSRDPAIFERLKRDIPDVSFVFDVKQCLRAGVAPEAMIDAMGQQLHHVHISDSDPDSTCLALGKGQMDLTALLRQLKCAGFNQDIILELYSHSYRHFTELTDSVSLLDRLLQQLSLK